MTRNRWLALVGLLISVGMTSVERRLLKWR